MSHKPDRAPVAGNRKLGDLSQRVDAGNQSMDNGGRWDTDATRKIVKEDSKKALMKAQQKKTNKAGKPEPVILNPEKEIIAQGIN
jgi:hypothetical protein